MRGRKKGKRNGIKRKQNLTNYLQIFLYESSLLFCRPFPMDFLAVVVVDIFMALAAYVVTDNLISSRSIKDSFIKANLFGKDLNKTSEDKV